jgi:hypothetical protein
MACDLIVTSVIPYPPTSPGGFGYVEIYFTTSDQYVNFSITGAVNQPYGVVRNTGVLYAQLLPAGGYTYTISRQSDPTCVASADFVVGPAPAPVDPSLNDPARWEPVGGVLPNPVLLKVEASLTDANGAARAGLHVEVELWRPAAVAAFVSFRATLRQAVQYVDAAPYLRAELVALQRYAATASSPLIDADASLRFYYRYRVVDKAGPEQWLTRAGERYAVLAALPEAADTMAPYVADTTGAVASVFDDYEGAQFVGLPLECTVLLPPATPGQDRWAELRYLDAYRNEVEIRSYALAPTLPAGVLRIPLPAGVLPCAAYVEVSVRDDNRAYAGTCSGTTTPTPLPTPGHLLTNGGYLQL